MANQDKKTPDYQDELDVYEVLFKLEKARNVKLLPDDKREQLLESRPNLRELSGEDVSLSSDAKKRSIDDAFLIARNVAHYLYASLYESFASYFPRNWSEMGKNEQRIVRDDLFELIYGMSPQRLAYDLFNGLVGKKNA